MPMKAELSIPAGRWDWLAFEKSELSNGLNGLIGSRDSITVLAFCAVGLLLTACCVHLFPAFSESVQSLQQFL